MATEGISWTETCDIMKDLTNLYSQNIDSSLLQVTDTLILSS